MTAGSISCYQESVNVSTSCGGLSTGSYSVSGSWDGSYPGINVIDGNWSTFGMLLLPTGTATVLMNYSSPVNKTNGTKWLVSEGTPLNLTIPVDCELSPLQLKAYSYTVIGAGRTNWSCYNSSSSWKVLRSTAGYVSVYEEAVYWNITSASTSCDCPASGDWYIGGCTITSSCVMSAGSTLYINGTATVQASITGCHNRQNNGFLTRNSGGSIVCNG